MSPTPSLLLDMARSARGRAAWARLAALGVVALVAILAAGCTAAPQATSTRAAIAPAAAASADGLAAAQGPSDLEREKEAEAAVARAVAQAEAARVAAEAEAAALAAELESARRAAEQVAAVRGASDVADFSTHEVWCEGVAYEEWLIAAGRAGSTSACEAYALENDMHLDGPTVEEEHAAWVQHYLDEGYLVPATQQETQEILDQGGACDMGEVGLTICELLRTSGEVQREYWESQQDG